MKRSRGADWTMPQFREGIRVPLVPGPASSMTEERLRMIEYADSALPRRMSPSGNRRGHLAPRVVATHTYPRRMCSSGLARVSRNVNTASAAHETPASAALPIKNHEALIGVRTLNSASQRDASP